MNRNLIKPAPWMGRKNAARPVTRTLVAALDGQIWLDVAHVKGSKESWEGRNLFQMIDCGPSADLAIETLRLRTAVRLLRLPGSTCERLYMVELRYTDNFMGIERVILARLYDISKGSRSLQKAREMVSRMDELKLREVHHRTKNNLQLISSAIFILARKMTDQETKSSVVGIGRMVDCMSTAHECLQDSAQAGRMGFRRLLEQLTRQLVDAFRGDHLQIQYQINLEEANLPPEALLNLGMVYNEILTNVFKHSFSGRDQGSIQILGYRDEGEPSQYFITLTNDGTPCPPGFNVGSCQSFGMKLMQMLLQQMGGRLSFNPDHPNSITLQFELPTSV